MVAGALKFAAMPLDELSERRLLDWQEIDPQSPFCKTEVDRHMQCREHNKKHNNPFVTARVFPAYSTIQNIADLDQKNATVLLSGGERLVRIWSNP